MRKAEINRKTKETDIKLELDIDGKGEYDIKTDCGFLNHMLELFARHGRFDLTLSCEGDSEVDFHHTTEDIGIALGQAFKKALGEKKGINRYGNMLLPMDEALVLVTLDISGRTFVNYEVELPAMKITDESKSESSMMAGAFDTELAEEFFNAFSRELGLTLHMIMLDGSNSHHIIEAEFKGFARALSKACLIDERYIDEVPSTKGIL